MRIIDISVPIYTGMVYYPGDPGAVIEPVRRIAQGDDANILQMQLGSHTGTHVDAPHHFKNGLMTVDNIPLEILIGPVRVVDLSSAETSIHRQDLEDVGVSGAERLIVKTANSRLWPDPEFKADYISLADGAADLLVEEGMKLIGTDYLSIERFKSDDYYVHRRLLEAGVIILEGLDLTAVDAGDYELVCLPLKIMDGDGAPARAVLIDR